MPPGAGPAITRVAAVVPVILLVLFTGLLWLLGLMCGRERRRYVIDLSQQAMGAIGVLLHGPAIPVSPPARVPRRRGAAP
jgi:fumarate reductase subunit D